LAPTFAPLDLLCAIGRGFHSADGTVATLYHELAATCTRAWLFARREGVRERLVPMHFAGPDRPTLEDALDVRTVAQALLRTAEWHDTIGISGPPRIMVISDQRESVLYVGGRRHVAVLRTRLADMGRFLARVQRAIEACDNPQ
jgi:hypothetical protein